MPVFDLGGGVAAAPPQTPKMGKFFGPGGGIGRWRLGITAAAFRGGAPYFPWGSVQKCLYLVGH
jgi:hypothetical protein